MECITHGSTFSGIGAPEVAAEMLGWQNLFHCEINPFGRKVLDYYFTNAKSYEDITKTDFSEWQGKVTVLTGGFPCQPFSYAGKRRGSEDDRYLWPFMLRCIEQVRPRWFVGENVAGITTMEFPDCPAKVVEETDIFGNTENIYKLRQQFVLNEIIKNLESIGYSVQPLVIPACAVGAPHRRDRVFIIAHKIIEDSLHSRRMGREHDKQECERNIWDAGARSAKRICREKVARTLADTESVTRCHGESGIRTGSKSRLPESGECYGKGIADTQGLLQEHRWRSFPTVSPVYRGNDGLPFPVDNLTIPFGEWKREILKAYGNAIVPQVMYEIFRCIQEIEQIY